MSKSLTLRYFLLRRALPSQTLILVILAMIQAGLFYFYSQPQIAQRHVQNTERLINALDEGKNSALEQMRNLASNDFVVNSLVDLQQQQYYLPLFFQSLRINNDDNASIAFFNFDGDLIASNNFQPLSSVLTNYDWQKQVLEQGKDLIALDQRGVTFAVPVFLSSDFVEGALVFHSDSLAELIRFEEDDSHQLIVDGEGRVLFATSQSPIPVNTQLAEKQLSPFVSQQSSYQGLQVLSFESYFAAYTTVVYLLPFIFLTILSALFAILYSTNSVAQLGATTLQQLRDRIESGFTDRKNRNTADDVNQIVELDNINRSFSLLKKQVVNLSLSNDLVNSVIDGVLEFMVVVDNDNQIMLCNRAYEEFVDKADFSETQLLALLGELRTGISAEQVGHKEKRYVDNNMQKSQVVHWYATPLYDQSDTQLGNVIVGEDLTLRRTLESDLLLKTQAVDRASTSILISDISQPGEPIIYTNAACETLTGYAASEFIGRNCRFLQGPDTNKQDVKLLRKAINNREPIEVTLLNYKKDGSEFYNHLTLTPIRNDDGTVTHYLGIQQDVTAQKQAAQYLNQAKSRAEESSRMKANFLANMSHEIRTPINGIYGVLQLLDGTSLTDKQHEFVSLALTSTQNLLHIINDILDLSKIEAGKLAVERIYFDPNTFVSEIVESYRILAKKKGLAFVESINLPQQVLMNGDPTRIRQVTENLLSNAVKFTDQGQIYFYFMLSGEEGQQQLSIVVKDTGIGIAQSKIDAIFDQFSQEDITTTREFGGTGLGLSITRQLCQLMDGSINVASEKGQGSAFAVSLPVTVVANDVKRETEGRADEDTFDEISKQSLSILLVEDNEINQAVAEHQLEAHHVVLANNGQEAINLLSDSNNQFDVILMDCQMPVMDGFEASRQIRAGSAGTDAKQLPIIALTANAMKGDRELCIEAGMDDYISKPFEASELNRKVRQWGQHISH